MIGYAVTLVAVLLLGVCMGVLLAPRRSEWMDLLWHYAQQTAGPAWQGLQGIPSYSASLGWPSHPAAASALATSVLMGAWGPMQRAALRAIRA